MLIPIIISVLALAAGAAGGYFFFRLRFNRKLGLTEAREMALKNREAEIEAIHQALSAGQSRDNSAVERLQAAVEMLTDEVQQKELEISVVREEHEFELRALQQELANVENGHRVAGGLRMDIEDVVFETSHEGLSSGIADEREDHGESPGFVDDTEEQEGSPEFVEEIQDQGEEPGVFDEPDRTGHEAPRDSDAPSGATEESEDPRRELDEPAFSPVDWASSVFGQLYRELRSALAPGPVVGPGVPDTSEEKPAASKDERAVPKEAETVAAPDGGQSVLDAAAPDGEEAAQDEESPHTIEDYDREGEAEPPIAFHTSGNADVPDAPEANRPFYPPFRAISDLFFPNEHVRTRTSAGAAKGRSPNAERAGLQLLLGLSDEEFIRLANMGYRTYEDIALLSSSDILTLSHEFDVPESKIEHVWISGAQLRLYESS